MKTVVLADYSRAAVCVVQSLLLNRPDIDPTWLTSTAVPLASDGKDLFKMPKDLGLGSLPLVRPLLVKPDFVARAYSGYRILDILELPVEEREDAGIEDFVQWSSTHDVAGLSRRLSEADEVYIVFERSSKGAYIARRLEQFAREAGVPHNALRYVRMRPHRSMPVQTKNEITARLSSPIERPDLESLSVKYLTWMHFHRNYLANSLPIMRATSMAAIGRDARGGLERQALQVLFALRTCGGMDAGAFSAGIDEWSGSGRYGRTTRLGYGPNDEGIDIVLSHLCDNGLATILDERAQLTGDGEALLAAMHPDCEDPDQQLRLEAWLDLPEADARAKADQYVRTFFGKQVRFLNAFRTNRNGMELSV